MANRLAKERKALGKIGEEQPNQISREKRRIAPLVHLAESISEGEERLNAVIPSQALALFRSPRLHRGGSSTLALMY
jgi:hypothetical protein